MHVSSLPNTLSFIRQNQSAQTSPPTSHEERREPSPGQLTTQNDVPDKRRLRRGVPAAAVRETGSADDFFSKVESVKQSQGREAYIRGYNSPGSVPLPAGYSDLMSSSEFYKMALQPGVTDEQLGMLKHLAEKRTIIKTQERVMEFSNVVSGKETKLTPMPQSYYLAMINQSSDGECAGISHLLSLATREGKADISWAIFTRRWLLLIRLNLKHSLLQLPGPRSTPGMPTRLMIRPLTGSGLTSQS